MQNLTPELYLKIAKDIDPEIFENKTPLLHIKMLEFLLKEGQFKAIAVFRGAGKTTLFNKIFILNQIFLKQEPFTLIVSSVEDKAIGFLEALKKTIDLASSKGYAIARGKVWNKDKIEVISNKGIVREGQNLEQICHIASISAGQDPRGYIKDNRRPSLLIVDDLESFSGRFGVESRSNRQKLRRWFYADLMPALHPSQGRCILIGTIVHEDSILNNIINNKDETIKWERAKFPIIESGKPAWADRFPLDKILSIKNEFKGLGLENSFYQEYMCAAIDPEKVLFKREYFRYFDEILYDLESVPTTILVTDGVSYKEVKTRRAKSIKFGSEVINLDECRIFTTIDLASSKGKDKTAIITSAIDKKNRIFVIDISSGRWTPFEKSVEIVRVFMSFSSERIGIEKAGMQNEFFYTIDTIQKLTGIRLPVEGLSHGGKEKNKRIANLEPYYRTGQIYHNATLSDTQELEAELLSFDVEVESKSDDLMDALAYVLQYLVGRFFDESEISFDEAYEVEWA